MKTLLFIFCAVFFFTSCNNEQIPVGPDYENFPMSNHLFKKLADGEDVDSLTEALDVAKVWRDSNNHILVHRHDLWKVGIVMYIDVYDSNNKEHRLVDTFWSASGYEVPEIWELYLKQTKSKFESKP